MRDESLVVSTLAKLKEEIAMKRSLDGKSPGENISNEIHPRAKRVCEEVTAETNDKEGPTEEPLKGIEKALRSKQIVEFDLGWISKGMLHPILFITANSLTFQKPQLISTGIKRKSSMSHGLRKPVLNKKLVLKF